MKGFWKFCKGLFKDDCRDLYTIDCQALGFMVSGLRFRDTDAARNRAGNRAGVLYASLHVFP